MKKVALVLVVTLASNTSYTFYGNQLIQKEHNQEQTKLRFLDADAPNDEYGYNDQSDMDEYDQHVCDDAQSPKISAAEALIKEMLSFVLIQCLTIKEMASFYCQGMKDVIQKWFTGFTKA